MLLYLFSSTASYFECRCCTRAKKEFVITKAQTHDPEHSVSMLYGSRVHINLLLNWGILKDFLSHWNRIYCMKICNKRISSYIPNNWPINFYYESKEEWASMYLGRETWSSGYGRRLMFQRSRVRIPAPYIGWTFSIFICCKNNNVYLKKRK